MNNFDPTLLNYLTSENIEFEYYEHVPVFTVEESEQIKNTIPWAHTKNLFLTDKKWWFYLVSIAAHKRFPVNLFRKQLGTKELSFASAEQLYEKIRLTPWSVSLFWLMYDTPPDVHVYLDQDLRIAPFVGRHPNRNDATIILAHSMIEKFLQNTGHLVHIISFDDNTVTCNR